MGNSLGVKGLWNCGTASVGKWNAQRWYKKSFELLNFHREEKTKLVFWVSVQNVWMKGLWVVSVYVGVEWPCHWKGGWTRSINSGRVKSWKINFIKVWMFIAFVWAGICHLMKPWFLFELLIHELQFDRGNCLILGSSRIRVPRGATEVMLFLFVVVFYLAHGSDVSAWWRMLVPQGYRQVLCGQSHQRTQ